jgi:signal transduction histidine kinase
VKTIRARLTLWYALTATATLAVLFILGYFLLQNHLIRGLDLLNASEFEQIRARLGPDYRTLDQIEMDERIRETTDYAAVLFYIDIHGPQIHTPEGPKRDIIFSSRNLHGAHLPDVPGERVFDVQPGDIGELRVGEFLLPPYDVNIATPLGQVRQLMRGYVQVCAALLALMVLVSVAVGFGFSNIVLRPVRLIRETANRIRSDNLSERIAVADVKDEVADLARLLNQMFDRLEASFGEIRRFAAEASHELKTPLSLVRLHAEKLVIDGALTPWQREAVQVQLEELARANRIIEDLLFIARADAQAIRLEVAVHDIGRFAQGFAQDAAVLAEHQGCRFTYSHHGEPSAAFDPRWMRQLLLNLLSNALKASPPGGEVRLTSENADGFWRVSIDDQGPGLPAAQRRHMFERFVRFPSYARDEKGSGLGLAICRSIAELHRGRIYASDTPSGAGLRVVAEIPAGVAAAGAEPRPAAEPVGHSLAETS